MKHHVLLILADVDRFQAMRGGLKPGASVDYTSQILLVVVIAVVIAAVVFAVRYFNSRAAKPCYAPGGLFNELSRVHALDRTQQKLLRTLADDLKLEHPSRVFLEPQLFDLVLRGNQHAAWQTPERRNHLEAIRIRLFSDHLDLIRGAAT